MRIINQLGVASGNSFAKKLTLGTALKAKLSTDEISIAEAKGWTVN